MVFDESVSGISWTSEIEEGAERDDDEPVIQSSMLKVTIRNDLDTLNRTLMDNKPARMDQPSL